MTPAARGRPGGWTYASPPSTGSVPKPPGDIGRTPGACAKGAEAPRPAQARDPAPGSTPGLGPVASLVRGLLLAALGIASFTARAGTDDDGGLWLAAFGQGALGTPAADGRGFRWWLDLHARWRDGGSDLDTTIIRPAVGYTLTPRVTLLAGYAYVVTHPADAGAAEEHRPWQQLTWMIPLGTVTLASRTRLEQRFVEAGSEAGWRLRQFVRVTKPVGARSYATAYDEAFFELNDTGWGQRAGLRQNRAFAGLGWFIDAHRKTAVEIGYLNQWIDRPGDDGLNHILSINLFINR
jgi:hypothetical protein